MSVRISAMHTVGIAAYKQQMPQKQRSFFKKLSRLFRYGSQQNRGKNARGYDTTVGQMRRGTISVVQKSQSPSFANMTGNVYNLTERLMRYQDFCLGAGTLVYTLDGVQTIRDLAAKHPNGERFFVYSYDYELKRPVIGTAFLPRIANDGAPSKRLRITFDDGGYLDCTPDHRVILRDGSTREAGELRADDSLMPLYVSDIDGHGYKWTYMLGADAQYNGWMPEHRLVAEHFYGRIPDDHVVHHVDFDKKNNHPSNLRVMTDHDHRSYHAQLNNVTKFGKQNASHSAWMRENSLNRRADVTFNAIVDAYWPGMLASDMETTLGACINVIKLRLQEHGFRSWTDFVERFSEAQQLATHVSIVSESRTPMIEEIMESYESCASLDELASRLKCTRNAVNRRLQANGIMCWTELKSGAAYAGRRRGPAYVGPSYQDFCSAYKPSMTQQELAVALGTTKNKLGTCLRNAGFFSYTKWTEQFKNHKVASVEPIEDDVVYTITVEKHHNLGVGSVSHKDPARRLYSMIFVTQCEMEYTPELASALDIYADESVAGDEKDRVFHIFSTNEAIKESLEDLFYNILNVEFNLRGWVRNLPVRASTPIPLLDGRTVTIAELTAERLTGRDDHWVYSVQDGTHRIVPGRVRWCGMTRRASELVRVTLDDATHVDCTPDHEWIMRDGSAKRADQLLANDRLMPLYRRQIVNGKRGYEQVYDPSLDKNVYTHRAMALHHWKHDDVGKIVHHVNFNRHDNVPSNLRVMTAADHVALHRQYASAYNSSPLHKLHNVQRAAATRKMWNERRAELRKKLTLKFDDRCVELFASVIRSAGKYVSPSRIGEQLAASATFMEHFKLINSESKRDVSKALRSGNGIANLLRRAGRGPYLDFVSYCAPEIAHTALYERAQRKSDRLAGKPTPMRKNHRVVSVERLVDVDDVYCMDVRGPNGEHDRHNFAVSSLDADNLPSINGTFLRNCKYGDLFLLNELDPDRGIVRVVPLPVNEIEREEGYDPQDPTLYRFRWVTLGNRELDCWQVTHMRLLGNDQFLPYGMSVIESARRIWRQLILMEDAMLTYRIVRAPERRVFYIDVGNTPPEEVPLLVEDAKRNIRSAPVVDRTTGRADLRYNPVSIEEDFWIPVRGTETGTKIETLQGGQNAAAVEDVQYIQRKLFAAIKIPKAYLGYDDMLSCFVPSTRVALLDGRSLTMPEIRDELAVGKRLWTYSCDPDTGNVVPGEIEVSAPTRPDAELVRVTLDNGESFDCTPDHKWMLRDRSWCEASMLQPGASLMPLHKRNVSLNGGADYEQVYDPGEHRWTYTHRLVASRVDGGIAEDASCAVEPHVTIHHRNVNRFDNSPENLIKIGWDAHRQLHQDMLADVRKQALADGKYSGQNNGWAKKCRQKVAHIWSIDKLIAWCGSAGRIAKHDIIRGYGLTETQLLALIAEAGMTYAEFADKYVTGGYKERGARGEQLNPRGQLAKRCQDMGLSRWIEVSCLNCANNFKTQRLKPAKFCNGTCYTAYGRGKQPSSGKNHSVVSVQALTERQQTWCISVKRWHNFALANGSFVANSKATLAQEDIRFSRTIAVIQKTLIAEMNRLAIMHLYCLGFPEQELQDFSLRLSNPSTVAQQQKLELLRAKAEIAGSFPDGMVDKEWIRKEVIGFTDEHIARIDERRLAERIMDAKIEAAGEPPEEGGGGGGGGGGSLFGDTGGSPGGDLGGSGDDLGAIAAGESPSGGQDEPAAGGDEPEADVNAADDADDELDEPDVSLLMSVDDPSEPTEHDRAQRRAKRKRHHGASALAEPDFGGMLRRAVEDDPFDSHWLRQAGKNPLAERSDRPQRTSIPADLAIILRRLPRRERGLIA